MSVFEKFQQPANNDTSFAPTTVSHAKYAKVVEGRNRFLVSAGVVGCALGLAYMAPLKMIRRLTASLWQQHCNGKVLDLSPKLNDAGAVALYESSKAVRVEFLVKDKEVADKPQSRFEVSQDSEESERDKRQAMTLVHLCRNDPIWIASAVTFDVVDEKQVSGPSFTKYDTVVIRNELCNYDDAEAEAIVKRGLDLLKDGGQMIVCETGQPRSPLATRALRWFHQSTNSSFHLYRDYCQWLAPLGQSCGASLIAGNRCVFGSYYGVVLRKGPPK